MSIHVRLLYTTQGQMTYLRNIFLVDKLLEISC